MTKPSYEELLQEVDQLKSRVSELEHELSEQVDFINEIPDPIGVGKPNGILTKNNCAFSQMFGYDEQYLLEQSFFEFLHKEDREKVREAFLSAEEATGELKIDARFRCKDGSYTWVEWRISYLSSPRRFIAIGRDVSSRKWADAALRQSQERFKIAGQVAYDLIYEWDVQTDSIEWFGDIDGILGFDQGTISKTIAAWLELIHPEDRDQLTEAVEFHRTSTQPIKYSYRILQRDGNYRYWKAHGFPLIDDTGQPYRWIGVCKDTTSQRIAEKALQESEEKYRNLVNSIPDLLYRTDLNGLIVFISPSVYEMSGYTVEEAMGMKMAEEVYAHPEERQLFLTTLQKDGYVRNFEAQLKRKDGSVWWASTNAQFYKDAKGNIKGIEGITRDVTKEKKAAAEKKHLEAQLNRQEKMRSLGVMAGGIAHDLNNILLGVVSYPDFLLSDMAQDDPLRGPLEIIQDSGQRAVDVVSDLLTIARGVATSADVLNLTVVAQEFLSSGECRYIKENYPLVTVEKKLASDLLNVRCSPVHIKKSLMNLVLNAAESIEGEGRIVLSTDNVYLDRPLRGYEDISKGEYVMICVSDNGTGICQEDLKHIFEPFYTKKVMGKSGTGLGLAVVWNTVHDYNGYIGVDSNDEGTIFRMYFPVTRSELESTVQEIPVESYRGNGESILVVDDEERQREIAQVLLTRLGYKVKVVDSGEAAVEYLSEHRVDLVVLDMIMDPGIDGLETYERLLTFNPQQKAIIVSGFSQTERVIEMQRLGAGTYVRKPYVMTTIGRAVKEELGQSLASAKSNVT